MEAKRALAEKLRALCEAWRAEFPGWPWWNCPSAPANPPDDCERMADTDAEERCVKLITEAAGDPGCCMVVGVVGVDTGIWQVLKDDIEDMSFDSFSNRVNGSKPEEDDGCWVGLLPGVPSNPAIIIFSSFPFLCFPSLYFSLFYRLTWLATANLSLLHN